ncbi:MAG: hypothetical protein ABI857_08150, partial [Acidobacteriota bacterium]
QAERRVVIATKCPDLGLHSQVRKAGLPPQLLFRFSIFRKIVAGNQWASFGFIAAERELMRHSTRNKAHRSLRV